MVCSNPEHAHLYLWANLQIRGREWQLRTTQFAISDLAT